MVIMTLLREIRGFLMMEILSQVGLMREIKTKSCPCYSILRNPGTRLLLGICFFLRMLLILLISLLVLESQGTRSFGTLIKGGFPH